MILLERLVAADAENAQSCVIINDNSPFVRNGHVPAYVTIEYMAQTIAAYSGLQALERSEEVQIGFLLGTRKLKLYVQQIDVGVELVINITSLYNDGEMAAFECSTLMNDQIIAEATINVFQPGSPMQNEETQLMANNDKDNP